MRIFRLLPFLALMLTLPVYGLAGVASAGACQAQQQQMRMATTTVMNQSMAQDDCCPGQATAQGAPCKDARDHAATGKQGSCSPCKIGFGCKSPQSYKVTPFLTLPARQAHASGSAEPPPLLISRSPNGLWRPPRLI